MDDGFSTTVTRDGDATLILVTGEIDIATCERLRDAIEPHLGPQQTIILDLSGVEFMDSSSIHVLVQARGALTADGGSLFLRNPSVAAHRGPPGVCVPICRPDSSGAGQTDLADNLGSSYNGVPRLRLLVGRQRGPHGRRHRHCS